MSKKTIESLCFSGTKADMWDELNRDVNTNRSILHLFVPNSKYNIRFLGPFMRAKRIYTGGLKEIINKIDIKGILNGSKESYEGAIKAINHHFGKSEKDEIGVREIAVRLNTPRRFSNRDPNPIMANIARANIDPYREALTQLSNLYKEDKYWQKCILVNAICEKTNFRSPPDYPIIQIIALSTMICDRIINATDSSRRIVSKCRINGLFAHNIELSKTGHGINSKYDVTLLPESCLSEQVMNKVVTEGLYDIPVIISEANKKRCPFIYRLGPNYRMSTELMGSILEEYKKFEENKHIDKTEEKINEIPIEAFEQINNMRDGIGSLEV